MANEEIMLSLAVACMYNKPPSLNQWYVKVENTIIIITIIISPTYINTSYPGLPYAPTTNVVVTSTQAFMYIESHTAFHLPFSPFTIHHHHHHHHHLSANFITTH